jgi:hypothetical protein
MPRSVNFNNKFQGRLLTFEMCTKQLEREKLKYG